MAIGLKQVIDNFNTRTNLYHINGYTMEALRAAIAFMSFQTVTNVLDLQGAYNYVVTINANLSPPDPPYTDPTAGA